jgi:MarR family transcriptional regulator, transcriptional regulator for hemolysin
MIGKRSPDYNLSKLPLGRAFAMLAKSYFGALTKQLENCGIERHFSAILLIYQAEKEGVCCSQQSIADLLDIDKVTMVRIVDYLIQKNFIVKSLNPSDRREYFLKLTAKAKKQLPGITKAIEELNKITFKGIEKNEIESFYRSLSVMEKNLKKVPADEYLLRFRKVKKS